MRKESIQIIDRSFISGQEDQSPQKVKNSFNPGLMESVFSVSTKAFNFYNIHDEFEDQNQSSLA